MRSEIFPKRDGQSALVVLACYRRIRKTYRAPVLGYACKILKNTGGLMDLKLQPSTHFFEVVIGYQAKYDALLKLFAEFAQGAVHLAESEVYFPNANLLVEVGGVAEVKQFTVKIFDRALMFSFRSQMGSDGVPKGVVYCHLKPNFEFLKDEDLGKFEFDWSGLTDTTADQFGSMTIKIQEHCFLIFGHFIQLALAH